MSESVLFVFSITMCYFEISAGMSRAMTWRAMPHGWQCQYLPVHALGFSCHAMGFSCHARLWEMHVMEISFHGRSVPYVSCAITCRICIRVIYVSYVSCWPVCHRPGPRCAAAIELERSGSRATCYNVLIRPQALAIQRTWDFRFFSFVGLCICGKHLTTVRWWNRLSLAA